MVSGLIRRLRERFPRIWTFLVARFARGEYLGLHLTVGFLASAAGLWLFAALTEQVLHHAPITSFDTSLLEWLHRRATPAGYAVFGAISRFGSFELMVAVGLVGVALLAVRRRWVLLAGWL